MSEQLLSALARYRRCLYELRVEIWAWAAAEDKVIGATIDRTLRLGKIGDYPAFNEVDELCDVLSRDRCVRAIRNLRAELELHEGAVLDAILAARDNGDAP